MSIAIKCPKCGRTLGDTDTSIKAHINCKRCGAQDINIKVATFDGYLTSRKEANDKSE